MSNKVKFGALIAVAVIVAINYGRAQSKDSLFYKLATLGSPS